MADAIEPALTPEEWDSALDDLKRWPGTFGHHVVMCIEGNEGGSEDLHAAAAYALHGQPFGFSWEDVDALRDWAEWMGRHGPWSVGINGTSYNAEFPASIADRIQALLPPRQP